MKKLISTSFLLLLFAPLMAQQTPSTTAGQNLWQKSRTQRTLGFVLLGAGTVVGTIGLATGVNNVLIDAFSGKENVKGTGAMIAGVSLMAASIPLFIAASKNRKRSLSVTGLSLPQPIGCGVGTYRTVRQVQFNFTHILL